MSFSQNCDYQVGDPISIIATGGQTIGYTTSYVMADYDGTILDVQSSPSFPSGTTENLIQILAVNYQIGSPPASLALGGSIFSFTGCVDVSNHLWLAVCGVFSLPCNYMTSGMITLNASGGNSASSYITEYIMADSSGVILQISNTPSFSTSQNGGVFEFYAVNYLSSSLVLGFSVGQNVSVLSGTCYDLGDYIGAIICDPIVLSVELSAFEVVLNSANQVDLSWTTTSELNNDYFQVERSRNLLDWDIINDEISSVGTNQGEVYYTDIDRFPLFGTAYYRLKQVDFDGTFSYSEIRVIDIKATYPIELSVYPNPSSGVVNLINNGNAAIDISIFRMDGKLVQKNLVIEQLEVDLPTGIYIIKSNQLIKPIKVIINK